MSDSSRELTPTEAEDYFYAILAGGARHTLFLSALDLNLPALLAEKSLSAAEILLALGLQPHRGRKWLHLLTLCGIIAEQTSPGDDAPRYTNSAAVRALFGASGTGGWFYREFLRYWRLASMNDVPGLLYGKVVEYPVRYPPNEWSDVVLLHDWMRNTALTTLEKLEKHADFAQAATLLDVGGGDGTMAIELARHYPQLTVTVFNLASAVALAHARIAEAGSAERVNTAAGDFRTDPLPSGYDVVLFSRVLADWPPEVCRLLLTKSRAALNSGGRLIICEPLQDENPDLAITWEQSYLPFDDFGLRLYKPLSLYRELLAQAGFRLVEYHPRDDASIHSVIVAQPA